MKAAITITLVLVAASASAQDIRYSEQVKFGDETVTLKITNSYDFCVGQSEQEQRLMQEKDPTEQERLSRLLWDCGDSWQLPPLATAYERRMDFVGAYTHLYAADQIAKVSRRYHPEELKVRGPVHDSIAKDLTRIGGKLSASQRASAVRQAAQLIRNNPNCCMAI